MKPFTFEDRKVLVDEVNTKLKDLMLRKGKEYAQSDTDTLANFTRRAQWMGVSRKALLFTDLSKHLDALCKWAMQDKPLTVEQADNRLFDVLVYTTLLIALYRQENEKS